MIGTHETGIEIEREGHLHHIEADPISRGNVTNEGIVAATLGTDGESTGHQTVAGHEDEAAFQLNAYLFYSCSIMFRTVRSPTECAISLFFTSMMYQFPYTPLQLYYQYHPL